MSGYRVVWFVVSATAMVSLTMLTNAAPPTPTRIPLKEVMVKVVEPASNAVFYISRQAPKSEDEWKSVQGQALVLSEIATSLMMPARAKDQLQWMADAKLLLDAGNAAYTAANAKNVVALEDLNDQLYTACTTCHEHYLARR